MRHALKDDRFDGMDSLVVEEVKEAYEMVNLIKECRTMEQTAPLPLYISDRDTDHLQLCCILHAFASLTHSPSLNDKHTEWKQDKALYDALP